MTKIIIFILIFLIIFYVFTGFASSAILYTVLLVRTSKKKWSRKVNLNWDDEYKKMYEIGFEWARENEQYKEDVSIVSEGYKLYGEYFDFGFDKAVIVIAGRMECCKYAYFFAKPYKEAGYNLLAIDNRCHGLSEGRIHSLGYKEYRDIINWSLYLQNEKHIEAVMLHGICIGANGGMFALTAGDCPEVIKGMVAEGMFTTFNESLKRHLQRFKQPQFPMNNITTLYIKWFSKADILHDGPIFRIDKLKDKKLLMLYSREDIFSTPDQANALYEKANGKATLVWFDKGDHSRVRINNMEKYDETIKNFLADM